MAGSAVSTGLFGDGDWYARNRARTQVLFDLIADEAYYSRPIDLRHPIVFYEGHLPAFSFNTLIRRALGGASIDLEQDQPIWTESSYKYTAQGVSGMLEKVGFEPVSQWIDHRAAFALTLARAR